MSDTTKHESQGHLDIEPFGADDDGAIHASESKAPAAAPMTGSAEQLVVKPTPAPAARALEPQAAAAAATVEAPSEPPVILKGVKLDPLSTMSDGMGAVVERNDKAVATADADNEDGDDIQYGGLVGILQKHGKVLGIASALGIAGFVFMPHKAPVAPVAVPVAAPVATAPVTPAQATTAAPGGPDGAVGVTGGVEAHVGAASPDDQARLSAELQADAQAIPPGEQVCSNPHITSFDSMRCGQVGPKLYFQCAPDGRRWDVRKPGCENG